MKRLLIGIKAAIALMIFVGLLFIGFFFFAFGGATYFFHVPRPAVRYGEFPFCLTYELNGEIKVIEDTIKCEFDGFEVIGEAGKFRKWKLFLSDGNELISLLDVSDSGVVNEFGNKVLELYFSPGNAEYYMGETAGYNLKKAEITDGVVYSYVNSNIEGFPAREAIFSVDEAWDKFKIRLISWEVAPPIQNTFGDERQYWLQEETGT